MCSSDLLETPLRELLSACITRGKVECRLYFNAAGRTPEQNQLVPERLQGLKRLQEEVMAALPHAAPLSVAEVLNWPGLFGDETIDLAVLSPVVLEIAAEALAEFTASREREGGKLAGIILEKLGCMRVIIAEIAPLIPQAQALFAEKLRQRLLEALNATATTLALGPHVQAFCEVLEHAAGLPPVGVIDLSTRSRA